ncbi:YncE family protein [Amycolatopsis alkalitolerans]|uniref:YncE family protein n=1 Tax=Amycolatopsis alkalitolerans TaxID=2547244 RepID=A0A5C4M5T5_9PSEU|nr:YncE family protein [Amycolatopsis alkalitolerans]TNC28625.1 hypothetical protein FG385_05030 [Amycolatopsis alkalitolerans]
MFGRRALFTMMAAFGAVAVSPAEADPRVRTFRVGPGPVVVAVNSRLGVTYVGNSDGSVSVANGATVAVGGKPTDLAIDEVDGQVYAASKNAGTVTVLDPDGRLRSVVAGGPGAAVLDLDTTMNRLYVASGTTGSVAVIDTIAGTLTGLLRGPGKGFGGIRVDGQRQVAYLTNPAAGTVEVLDLGSGDFTASIATGAGPSGLALHEASNTVYVANSGIHHLSVIDGASRTERAKVILRSEASSVVVHQASNTVYANGGPDGLVKIDGFAGKIVDQLSLGINPGGMAIDQRTAAVCVTDPLHDQLYAIDGF